MWILGLRGLINKYTLLFVISPDASLISCFAKPSERVLNVSPITFDADFRRTTLWP